MMRSLAISIVALVLGVGACAPGYEFLGDRQVRGNGAEVHEGIGGLRIDGAFSAIRVVVEDAPLQMDDFWVTFGNGEVWHPGVRLDFGPGSTTRDIQLPGGLRHIRRVDFVMRNFPGNGHAHVQLYAR